MKIDKIDTFTKGWVIGNFEPSLFSTELFEVATKKYIKGDKEKSHCHKIATEYTMIVSGIAKMNELILIEGDIVTISPYEYTNFEALSDVITTVVKIPSVKNDKYELD